MPKFTNEERTFDIGKGLVNERLGFDISLVLSHFSFVISCP